jgi:hypothetical protein
LHDENAPDLQYDALPSSASVRSVLALSMATSVRIALTFPATVRRAAFCASIRIAAALVHSTVQFSMRCGVDLGVVTSGLAAIAPIPASGADVGPLIPAASTIEAAFVLVALLPLGFSAALLPCTIRAL